MNLSIRPNRLELAARFAEAAIRGGEEPRHVSAENVLDLADKLLEACPEEGDEKDEVNPREVATVALVAMVEWLLHLREPITLGLGQARADFLEAFEAWSNQFLDSTWPEES